MPPKKDVPSIAVTPGALKGTKCIITGEIEGMSRKAAEQVLVSAGATIEKSLNKNVQLVVLGSDAGPKKLEKVEELGVQTREWGDLVKRIKADGAAGAGAESDTDVRNDEAEKVKEKPNAKRKAATKAKTKANAEPKAKPAQNGTGSSLLKGKKVIITGTIPGHDRKSAQTLVENAGAIVAKSFNKQVELVILGTNPDPDKVAKIEGVSIATISWKDLAPKLGVEVVPEKEVANVKARDAPDSIDGMTLIITGEIDGHTRQSAQKLLESAGAKVAKSLTKSVELVVLGTKPGPDKLNKIADMGLDTCSWESLVEKLGIEDEVAEPPKKKSKQT